MHRFVFVTGLCCAFSLVLLPALPAAAITAKQKMVTCKIGADYLKLHGHKRARFLKRCMANPNGRRGSAASAAGVPSKPSH